MNALCKIHKGKYCLVKIKIMLWEPIIFLTFLTAEQELLRCVVCSVCSLAGLGSPSGSGSLAWELGSGSDPLLWLFHFFKPPSGQNWDWLHVGCLGSSPGSNSCSAVPGRCLPVIWCLSRDRHRVKVPVLNSSIQFMFCPYLRAAWLWACLPFEAGSAFFPLLFH